MQRKWLIGLIGLMSTLTTTLILFGCGGGGGPVGAPSNQNPGPTPSTQFVQLLPAGQQGATYVGMSSCLTCHGANGSAPSKIDETGWSHTKHAQLSIGCEQCHGPASKHVASPSTTNILTFPNVTNAVVCGQCHGPMMTQYNASAHATPVAEVIEESEASASTGKTCMRCHSQALRTQYIIFPETHGVDPVTIDNTIKNLPADQITALAQATKQTVACAGCHDPHRTTTVTSLDGDTTDQLNLAVSNENISQIFPGKSFIYSTTFNHTCASCHNGGTSKTVDPTDAAITASTARPNFHENPQYFMLMGYGGIESGTLTDADRHRRHADPDVQCVKCHMPNDSHTMTVNLDVSCAPCHSPSDAAARMAVQGEIQLGLFSLRSRMEAWALKTFGDKDLWDYSTQVPTGKTAPNQSLIPIELKRARHNYYFILRDSSYGIHNAKYARYLLNVAATNLDALGVSRAAAIQPSKAQIQATLKADADRGRKAELGGI